MLLALLRHLSFLRLPSFYALPLKIMIAACCLIGLNACQTLPESPNKTIVQPTTPAKNNSAATSANDEAYQAVIEAEGTNQYGTATDKNINTNANAATAENVTTQGSIAKVNNTTHNSDYQQSTDTNTNNSIAHSSQPVHNDNDNNDNNDDTTGSDRLNNEGVHNKDDNPLTSGSAADNSVNDNSLSDSPVANSPINDTANKHNHNTQTATPVIVITPPPQPKKSMQAALLESARQNSNPSYEVTTTPASDGNNIPAFRQLMDGGIAALKTNRLSDAESKFTRAQRLAPKSSAVYFYLGQVALKKNQPKKAEAMARRGLVVAEDRARRQALWQVILKSGQMQNNARVIKEATQALQ